MSSGKCSWDLSCFINNKADLRENWVWFQTRSVLFRIGSATVYIEPGKQPQSLHCLLQQRTCNPSQWVLDAPDKGTVPLWGLQVASEIGTAAVPSCSMGQARGKPAQTARRALQFSSRFQSRFPSLSRVCSEGYLWISELVLWHIVSHKFS